MSKSPNLMSVQEVARYFGVSTKTIMRRVEAAKSGTSSFPSPVFGYGQKLLFYRAEITGWKESEPGEQGQVK